MNEQEALSRMVAPGTRRKGKYMGGVIQIWVTRHCDKACFGCTQGSNLRHQPGPTATVTDQNYKTLTTPVQQFISVEQFEQALLSLKWYFGVVGMFGGNPAIHPQFDELCRLMRQHVPYVQRGIWSNNPMTVEKARIMRETFNPAHSNLNVHLDDTAYRLFKEGWPECHPVGLHEDSRHSPPYVAMKDVVTTMCPVCNGLGDDNVKYQFNACSNCNGTGKVPDESRIWELISDCDINKHWSAMIGVFRGELRAWFCEIAGAQAMLHQHEPDYPDTGIKLDRDGLAIVPSRAGDIETGNDIYTRTPWWQMDIPEFKYQVRKHCFDCGIPLRGYGELAQADKDGGSERFKEQCSATHEGIYHPKKPLRKIEIVTNLQQIGTARLQNVVRYLQNSHK